MSQEGSTEPTIAVSSVANEKQAPSLQLKEHGPRRKRTDGSVNKPRPERSELSREGGIGELSLDRAPMDLDQRQRINDANASVAGVGSFFNKVEDLSDYDEEEEVITAGTTNSTSQNPPQQQLQQPQGRLCKANASCRRILQTTHKSLVLRRFARRCPTTCDALL